MTSNWPSWKARLAGCSAQGGKKEILNVGRNSLSTSKDSGRVSSYFYLFSCAASCSSPLLLAKDMKHNKINESNPTQPRKILQRRKLPLQGATGAHGLGRNFAPPPPPNCVNCVNFNPRRIIASVQVNNIDRIHTKHNLYVYHLSPLHSYSSDRCTVAQVNLCRSCARCTRSNH